MSELTTYIRCAKCGRELRIADSDVFTDNEQNFLRIDVNLCDCQKPTPPESQLTLGDCKPGEHAEYNDGKEMCRGILFHTSSGCFDKNYVRVLKEDYSDYEIISKDTPCRLLTAAEVKELEK